MPIRHLLSGRPLQLLVGTGVTSALGFLAMLAASTGLPPAEYMLSFYWVTGANTAFSIAETGSIWAVVQGRSWAARVMTSRLFWYPVSLSGLLFVPRGASSVVGVALCLVLAEAFRRYLSHLIVFRRAGDYVSAQRVAALNAALRLGLTLATVALATTAPSAVPAAIALTLATALSYFASALARGEAAPTEAALPEVSSSMALLPTATLVLTLLMSRALVPAASHLPADAWRPFLTVVASVAMVAGNALLGLSLDRRKTRRLASGRWLVGGVAALGGALALLPSEGGGPFAAARLGIASGALTGAMGFCLVFGEWHERPLRCALFAAAGSVAYWRLLSHAGEGLLAPFPSGVAFCVLAIVIALWRTAPDSRRIGDRLERREENADVVAQRGGTGVLEA